MPTIHHKTGPLAGKEQTIDPRVERITFGRDPAACDVVFPPDLTIVARRHFAFVRKPSGEWMFEDFGDPFVAINGHPAEIDEGVPSGATVELGKKGGPSFEITFEGKDMGSALPVTEVQQKALGGRAAAARARRLAMAGVAVAVILALGTGAFMLLSRNEGQRLEAAMARLQQAQAAAAAESISAPVRDKLLQAAHVVIVQFASGQVTAQGSASPIAPDLLVTNAHVAELREKLGPGDKLMVRSPGANGKVYEITEIKLHPGYRAFTKFLTEDPIFVTSVKDCATCFPTLLKGSLSYDVALMRVAPGSNLGPVLELASEQELQSLRAGMPVALAGYPLENIRGSEMQSLGATPNFRSGVISAMTDMFNLPGEIPQQRLMHHNIPVTGGNSGSPMIAANGKLVALLNSGNVFAAQGGGRMPNAAVINYGQRADLVHELLKGTAEANLAAERAYWAKQTAAFKRGFDLIVPQLLSEIKPKSGGNATPVNQSKYTLTKGDSFKAKDNQGKDVARRQRIHSVSMKANVPGAFIVYAQERAPIQLYLVIDGQIVSQNDRGIWFPHLSYSYDKDVTADVYVVSPDQDVNYTLMQYSWDPPRS
jgi:V8-like Glu-specific endopeptidase